MILWIALYRHFFFAGLPPASDEFVIFDIAKRDHVSFYKNDS